MNAPGTITPDPSSAILPIRKKSRDESICNDLLLTAVDNEATGRGGLGERKKSGSSSNKEREISEGSIYFLSEENQKVRLSFFCVELS